VKAVVISAFRVTSCKTYELRQTRYMSDVSEPETSEPFSPGDSDITTVLPKPEDLDRSDRLRDDIQGVTTEHAFPPRLEDEGQSGG
jgi:hypothetical protein